MGPRPVISILSLRRRGSREVFDTRGEDCVAVEVCRPGLVEARKASPRASRRSTVLTVLFWSYNTDFGLLYFRTVRQ